METRSNYVMVGAVTLALLAGLLLFIVWLAGLSNKRDQMLRHLFRAGRRRPQQGLERHLLRRAGRPGQEDLAASRTGRNSSGCGSRSTQQTPVLQGTTAQIKGVGFTGVSEIQLDGAVQGRAADHASSGRRAARSSRRARAASARCSTARRS